MADGRRINQASWNWLRDALESGRVGNEVKVKVGNTGGLRVEYFDPPSITSPVASPGYRNA